MTGLVAKYRPKTFGEVYGQQEPISFLSKLILRGKIRRNLLFHGNVGSGKTTLVRLYAKALFCESPDTVDGSPCNACDLCRDFERGACAYREIDAPNQDEHQLRARLDDFERLLTASGPCFVFFDEAHALANMRTFFDSLLKRMEENESQVVYCFATTNVERLPVALKSRLLPFEIKALSTTAAVNFMEKIAADNGIKVEREALAALAGLARGQVRDLLQRMDQLRELGITLDNVQSVFGISDTTSLITYFEALASGDRKAQMRSFLDWNSEAADKLRLIQQFMTGVYLLDVHLLDVVFDPVIASIPHRVRASVVAAFRERLDKLGLDFESFWRGMLAFWPVVSSQTDAAIMMRLAQFHDFVNAPEAFGAATLFGGNQVAGATKPKRTPVRRRKRASDPCQLSRSVVEDIIDRAAFCTQHYGKLFNARITIWHDAFDDKSPEAVSKRVSEFGHHWTEWVGRHAPHEAALRLSVQEIDKARGWCLRIIAHFPDGKEDQAEKWCRTWKQKERSRSGNDAVEVEQRAFTATAVTWRQKWHRDNVLWLCGGIDREETGSDRGDQKLASLLAIPRKYLRPIGDIGSSNRLMASNALLPSEMTKAQENKMRIVSAFRMQYWKEIAGVWELSEYIHRRQTIEQRRSEIEDLRSNVAPAVFEAQRQALLASWSDDPLGRPRAYAVWWQTSQL